jgi:hypothetical protein
VIFIPIYEYVCSSCGKTFEQIEKVSSRSFKEDLLIPRVCIYCKSKSAFKKSSIFKINARILNTKDKSGYQDDDLTLGKIIDEGGIPPEHKRRLRDREKMIKRVNKYTKELKQRGKTYGFDPFSDKDERKN